VGDGAYKRLGKSSLPRRFAPASLRPDATPLMNRDQRKKSPSGHRYMIRQIL
jgi:hypothetical protein